jgi:succinate dehydrogenase/fumarate reductase flavoprotein subunit
MPFTFTICMTNFLRICEEIVRDDPHSEVIQPGRTESLLTDEHGAVTGAIVVAPDGEGREIRAGATLLATGGFQADPELRASIHPNAVGIPLRSNHFSTGDGRRLAQSVGGAFRGEDAGFYGHIFPAGVTVGENDDYLGITLYYSEHAVLFNLEGRRFVDETVGDHLNTLAVLDEPEGRALMVSDARVRDEWIMQPYVEGVHPRDTFDIAFQRGARAAVAESIDELEHLPEEWGYDGPTIRQALIDFNRGCIEGGLEPQRRFDSTPIDTPPFFVIEAVPAISFTFGGLTIDEHARVLDGGGAPIRGLFCAGADAGGVVVRAYAGGLAAALVFALAAAKTAIEDAAAVTG